MLIVSHVCRSELPSNELMSLHFCFRALNGFLNTGQGGIAYLGVLDDGSVKGLAMTVYQVRVHKKMDIPGYISLTSVLNT